MKVIEAVEVVQVIEDCSRGGGHLDTLDDLDTLDHLVSVGTAAAL